MGKEKDFLFLIEPKEFTDRVDFNGHSSTMKEMVRNSNGVVAPVDISARLSFGEEDCRSNARLPVELRAMASSDLESLLRSIPNKRREKIYEKSMISSGHISHGSLLNYQTFVQVKSLLGLSGLSAMLESFNSAGISNAAAFTISYKAKGEAYVAFYVPPIVETVSKEGVRIPLENLRKRAEKEGSVELSAYDGDGKVSFKEVIEFWDKILAASAINSVQVVRDGTHRFFLANTVGAPQYAILINGFSADLPSVPVTTRTIIKTSAKPKRLEDRYLGLHVEGWTDEKFVGIDG